MAYRIDHTPAALKSPKRRANGFLDVEAIATRSGVFDYGTHKEYRPPHEVGHPDSLGSLVGAPITLGHPKSGAVTPRTAQALTVGAVRSVTPEESGPLVALTVYDEKTITCLDAGNTGVSCGYECDYDPTPGVSPEGEAYDGVQSNIRYNHLAVGVTPRAGPIAHIRMDGIPTDVHSVEPPVTPKAKMKIRLDATTEVEVEDAVAPSIERALAALAVRADAAEAAMQAQAAAHASKLELVARAAPYLPLESLTAAADAHAIRMAVLAKIAPGMGLDGKSPAYVEAMMDVQLAALEAAKASHQSLETATNRADATITAPAVNPVEAARKRMNEYYATLGTTPTAKS